MSVYVIINGAKGKENVMHKTCTDFYEIRCRYAERYEAKKEIIRNGFSESEITVSPILGDGMVIVAGTREKKL